MKCSECGSKNIITYSIGGWHCFDCKFYSTEGEIKI